MNETVDQDLLDLIAAIRQRPAMYIGRQSVVLFAAHMRGYIDGRFANGDGKGAQMRRVMLGFQAYVQERYAIEMSLGWEHILMFFAGNDDSHGLILFGDVWDDYLHERSTKQKAK